MKKNFGFISLPLVATLVILSATLGASIWSDHREPEVLIKPLNSIPSQIAGWTSGGNETLRDTIVASLDATSYVSRTYWKGQDKLDMFTAFYAQQRAGESMHSPKYCLPGGGWEFSNFRNATLPTVDGSVTVNLARIQRTEQRRLILYWYQSRTRVVASEYESKLFLVWDGLIHANPGGSIVRVMLPERPEAEQDGLTFATQLLAEVRKCYRAE